MKIKCKCCGIELTGELVEAKSNGQLSEIENRDFIARGHFFVSDGEYYSGTENQIIINVKDLINSRNHTDKGRLNGCCGLDGCDGPNKLCFNGHEIATEISDCWIADAVIFDLDKINPR